MAKAGSWTPTTNADCKIANQGASCVGGGCQTVGTISPTSSIKRCDEGKAHSDLLLSWTHFAHGTHATPLKLPATTPLEDGSSPIPCMYAQHA